MHTLKWKFNVLQDKFSLSFFKLSVLFFIFILIVAAWGYYRIHGHYLILDEKSHYPQIELYSHGEWKLYVKPGDKYPENAVFPAYHFLAALFTKIAGACTPDVVRLFGVIASFSLMLIAYGLSRCFFDPRTSLLRAMQVYFLPILFPFYFLIYTDTLSAVTFLAAVYFTEKKKYALAGIAGCLCVLIRQNAIVFLPFLMAYAYYRDYGINFSKRIIMKFALANWVYILIFLSFGIFVLVNGRITLNAPTSHPPGLSAGNIIFSVICFGFLFLPEAVYRRKDISRWTQQHKMATWLILIASFYVFAYYPAHRWNQIPWLIRNEIINWLAYDIYTKIIFYTLTVLSLFALFSQRLINKGAYLIYPFWVLMLLPALLVEPRYYVIPFLLLTIFRRSQSVTGEVFILMYFAIISLLIHIVHTSSIYII